MQGTHCISGSGTGIVVLTGDNTVFGKIASLSAKRKQGMTTLQLEILRFVAVIVSAVLIVSIVVIIVWAAWLRVDHPGFLNVSGLIVSVVSVSVAFIPEGTNPSLPVFCGTMLIWCRSSNCSDNEFNNHRSCNEETKSVMQKFINSRNTRLHQRSLFRQNRHID